VVGANPGSENDTQSSSISVSRCSRTKRSTSGKASFQVTFESFTGTRERRFRRVMTGYIVERNEDGSFVGTVNDHWMI
jgi:hypothetical protein